MLLPTVLTVIGTWFLARQFSVPAIHAALLTLFTPVFLVSATTVMTDVPMLACWVWALGLWMYGFKCGRQWPLIAAALCAAMAPLTKYYGSAWCR